MRPAHPGTAATVSLLLVATLAGPALAQAPSSSPDAIVASGDGTTLWLDGPFGKVPGGTWLDPAPTADTPPLDTWVTEAPLALLLRPASVSVSSWSVAFGEIGSSVVVAEGGAYDPQTATVAFPGPRDSGDPLITAHIITIDGQELRAAWRVRVPDRPFPVDGVMDIPAPDLLLSSGEETITGLRADGCYVYLCVTIGRLPPFAQIAAVTPTSDVPMRLELSDGSGFVVTEATLTPLSGEPEPIGLEPRQVTDSAVDLPSPPPGAWLLSVEIAFDRERGLLETVFRLAPTDPAA